MKAMQPCRVQGNGVCCSCDHKSKLKVYGDDICAKEVPVYLDLLHELLQTELTEEQKDIICDFEVEII